MSFNETKAAAKQMGFALTLCFKCGRVDTVHYADQYLPREVRGDCEAENGIVVTLCELCRKMKSGDNDIGSLCSAFSGLGMSPRRYTLRWSDRFVTASGLHPSCPI